MRANIQIHAQVTENGQAAHHHFQEVKELLQQVLSSRQDISEIARMAVEERLPVAERLMSDGQQEMDLQPRDSQKYLDYQRGLLNLHQSTGVLPSVPNLSQEITRSGQRAVTGGTFSDVWMGEWLGGKKVALKGLRGVAVSPNAQKRFEREIVVWSKLDHPNILPLFGIVTNMGPHIHLVSPWQDNGNALDFVKSHPDVNRLALLAGAARGLEYLHSPSVGVVHGNVKCSNILISDKGVATICDFGLSILVEEVTEVSASATLTASGSARWLAPELIEGTINSPTTYTDIYGFSMAILECCTLKRPFAHRKRDAAVIRDVTVDRLHPPRPADSVWITDEVWATMCRSWSSEAHLRPLMSHVVKVLERNSNTSSTVEDDMMEE
ncbi:kinase-like protein [Sistotremastrum niveocremeum HHB9708]|uniref:Kinase-like protein n=1 Tax=Sistotremastrum niveocremeum HHB9708 TaxID=1314777 RepID=A0A165AN39_9AGAM|nr:kinase-like protein [Sistotremastrum niveocremeum HHB9708]